MKLLCQTEQLFLKVAGIETHEACAVACLVLSHLMNSVVSSVHTGSLGILGDTELVLASTLLSSDTSLKVGLGVAQNVAKQFGKLRSMLSLLECITLVSLGDFGITLAVGLTAHGKIHSNLCALTIEVSLEILDHFLVSTLVASCTKNVHGGEVCLTVISEFGELRCWSLTQWALLRCCLALIYVSTYGADKLFLHNSVVFLKCYT